MRKRSNKMKRRKKMMSKVINSLDLRRRKDLNLTWIQKRKSKRKNKLQQKRKRISVKQRSLQRRKRGSKVQ